MSIRYLSIAVALLGTVAPAQAQFERFPIIKKWTPHPEIVEMRKSWQDRAGDAVHDAEPDTWSDLPYWAKGIAQRNDWNAPELSDAPSWLLLDCTTHSNRWRLRRTTHFSWRKVCR
jgi:hypothetical protein